MAQNANAGDAAAGSADPLKLLGQVLALAVRLSASDIHLRVRNHPIMRVDGNLRAVREIAPLFDGKGGGKPQFAQASGKDAQKLKTVLEGEAVLDRVKALVAV